MKRRSRKPKQEPEIDEFIEDLADPLAVFHTSIAATLLQLDKIALQPDPQTEFLNVLKAQIAETQNVQFLPQDARALVQDFFDAVQESLETLR